MKKLTAELNLNLTKQSKKCWKFEEQIKLETMLKKLITSLFCAFLAPYFVGSVWGQTYNQVTTIGGLIDGDYLIIGDGANDGMMENTVTAATPYINYSSTATSGVGATITTGFTSANEFVVTVSGGVITIYNASVGYVSWGRTGNIGNTATYFNGTVANTEQWTPTVAGGLWTLSNVNTSTRMLQWNSGSPRFACYTTAQVKLKLYRKTVTCTPNITLGSIATPAGNINEGTTNNVIYGFSLATGACAATLTGFNFTTTGTAVNGNFNNMKVWYSTDNFFGGDTQIGSSITTGMGAGNHVLGGSINQTIAASTTGYIFVTADLPCGATAGNTVAVDAITSSNLTFSTTPASYSGSTSAGGTKTIVENAPVNVTGAATSACVSGGSTISWTAAINCPDNYLVVAKAGSAVTLAPSGNGGAYTANTVFGSGTAYDGGFVVYKNNGTSVGVTGLTNGVTYYFTIYTRNGTTWSSGVTVSCTPTLNYCSGVSNDAGFEYIQNVEFSTIFNPSANSTYSNFTAISGSVSVGNTYPLTVSNGNFYTADRCYAWIDWNGDGDFQDANELVMNNVASPYTSNVTVPVGAIGGRMRVWLYDSDYTGPNSSTGCGTSSYGEVEDYTIVVCTPTHTVSSFAPTTGPVGSTITITGTGFVAGATVMINGMTASTTFINSTTLEAVVNTGTSTGSVVVTNNSCAVASSTFTIIEETGNCSSSGSLTNLFISEVYDSDSGNGAYIELFNPTGSAINLAGYSIRLDNRNSGDPGVTIDRTINLSGTIGPGEVFLLNAGTSSSCSGLSFDQTMTGGGINEFDYIFLFNGGSEIDEMDAPNNTGYTWKRNNTASAPSTTYAAADWITSNTESCSDLGNFDLPGSNPTVSNLVDNSTCANVNYSASATPGSGGTLTYTWYYNNNVASGWTLVNASNPPNLTISGQNTNNLQISAGSSSISTIDNYQFYCLVTENGTCTNVSNAISFTTSSFAYYRSINTGNWTTVANWEMSPNGSTGWVSACTYPTATNSDGIVIRNGHNITMDVALTEDNLTVDVGGTLTLLTNTQMTLNDGTGTDMIINGTLVDNNNSANNILWGGSATWTLGTSATIVKTSNSSVVNYRDNYQGGISTIPATANWIYRYTNNGLVVVTTPSMYYPNLFFESTSGNHAWIGTGEVMVGSASTAVIKGNLSVGATGTGTVSVYNNNFNASPISVLGNVTVGAGSTLINQDQTAVSGNVGTGFDIKGNVTVTTPGVYDISYGTGKTTFSGTSMQTVSGGGTFKSYGFTLDNTAGATLNATDMELTNNLTFQSANGANQSIIYTTGTAKVNVTNNATNAIVNGVATSSAGRYIQGRLQWSLASGNTYTYPIGFAGHGAQGFNFSPTGAGNVLAYLQTRTQNLLYNYAYCDVATTTTGGGANIGTAGVNLTVGDGILDQIALDQHSPLEWEITQPSGSISQYNITVLATGAQALTLPPAASFVGPLRYLSKNGQPGNPTVPTTIAPDFSQTGFDLCPNNMTLTGMTSFSLFTLDAPSVNSVVVLPIEMIVFEGQLTEPNTAELHWATASEINNDFFTLEHSMDGQDWEEIAIVDGAGNSIERIDYYRQHRYLVSGIHYYRLWSTDFDGTVYNRGIVSIEVGSNGTAYYNNITQTIEMSEEGDYVIYSMDGKLIKNVFHGTSIPFCCETGIYLIHNLNSGETQRILIGN